MGGDKQLVFSVEEFQGRVRCVRQAMAETGLDLLLVHTPENIFYLTGYQTPGYYTYQCFILPLESEPVILTRRLEATNVMARSWVERAVTYTGVEDTGGVGPVDATCSVLRDIGTTGKRIGIERGAWFLTPRDCARIEAAFPDAQFIDATDIVNQARVIKSPAETAYIRQAARAAEKGMAAALAAIQPGKLDLDVAGAFLMASVAEGSEYTGLPPFVATGTNSAVTHATWERRRLDRGDAVFLELPACINRYHAALERTAIIGKPPAKWERIAEAVLEGLNAAIDTIKPGVTSGEVDAACRGVIKRAGFGEYYPHRCGYSIGIAFPPDWGEGHILSLRANDPTVLQPGMTFHIPPAVLMYGEVGIAFSETVLVTSTGCEVITHYPRKLFVVE